MQTIQNINNYIAHKQSVVTIGTFDGVHAGHCKVLGDLAELATKSNANSVLITFFPHPKMVLQSKEQVFLLNTIEERINLLQNTTLDTVIIQEFNEAFSKLSAEEFVLNYLVNKLKIAHLVVGYDHQFGKNREGSYNQLKLLGKKYNFKVSKTLEKSIKKHTVSSTKIRKALVKGKIKRATKFLGNYYMLTGKVVSGNNIGEKLGFPTANLQIEETYKLIPKSGAYFVKSTIKNKEYFGMMNIGNRPTINGTKQTIEVHFFDLNFNLYNQYIKVELLDFLRDEHKFESLELLKKQLDKDKKKCLKKIAALLLK